MRPMQLSRTPHYRRMTHYVLIFVNRVQKVVIFHFKVYNIRQGNILSILQAAFQTGVYR